MTAFAQNPGALHKAAISRNGFSLPISKIILSISFLMTIAFLSSCSQKFNSKVSLNSDNIETQSFGFDANQAQVIRGENGAILAIPANAFMDEMGNTITGKIDFRLKEANTDLAIVTGNLITRTGNELLATGGMYQIEAFQNGKALVLNPQIGIQAYLPAKGGKNSEMGLYKGESSASKLDWKLTGQKESDIPQCDTDKASRKHCKKCENLLKMAKHIKPGKKPAKNEYYAKRHYWENGRLYFASSGSKKPILSQAQLDECKAYLEATEKGRDLLATVEDYKRKWKDEIGAYYSYKLDALGWYNIDRLVKEDVFTFKGKVIDDNGNPVPNANVHLYCKDDDLKVHTSALANNGEFELKFAPGRNFLIYVYQDGLVGKGNFKLESKAEGQNIGQVSVAQMDPEAVDGFLKTLL